MYNEEKPTITVSGTDGDLEKESVKRWMKKYEDTHDIDILYTKDGIILTAIKSGGGGK